MEHSAHTESTTGSVGESFNTYQATIAMGSIFMGFVFAALLQLLGSDDQLVGYEAFTAYLLVAAMLLLFAALLAFRATSNRVMAYCHIMTPRSRARSLGGFLFVAGMFAMFGSTALMLMSAGLVGAGWIVIAAFVLVVAIDSRAGKPYRHSENEVCVDKPA